MRIKVAGQPDNSTDLKRFIETSFKCSYLTKYSIAQAPQGGGGGHGERSPLPQNGKNVGEK